MTPNPNVATPTGILFEGEADLPSEETAQVQAIAAKNAVYKDKRTAWKYIIIFAIIHFIGLYGFYLMFTSAKILTTVLAFVFYQMGILGITAGVHRLWSHRSYKATWQLRLLLVILQTIAYQDAVIDWARDHRVHHKYNETDADPYNARRGFFFSHIGWMFLRKHPDVKAKGKAIDFSDLYEDPFLKYQKKYYYTVMPILCFIIPTYLPMYMWNESFINAFCVNIFRYTFSLNVTLAVNSVAHRWGNKPYDKFLNPSENLSVSLLTLGEGWHNYHHAFPWDYKTAELGKYSTNLTTAFIDLMAKIGWAYDLKTASDDMIRKRVIRTGDGSHESHEIWGWGDKDQKPEEKEQALIVNKKDL